MSKKITICLYIILLATVVHAQKKSVTAVKISEPIKIDGLLDEKSYLLAKPACDFIQIQPFNGKPAMQNTEVSILYDENAIYVGARLYDTQPDSIFKYLTERDNTGMSDYFGIYFDPFNTGQIAYGFFITPAGVQIDIKATHNDGDNEDGNWNEVWESKTHIDKAGWTAEIRIPFTALRFPEGSSTAWGLNMFRNIRRFNSNNSWNMLDKRLMGFLHQQGELKGIAGIHSPLRLSLTPYIATYYEKSADVVSGQFLYKGGLDLKYGINDSYTLDMMVIPDFGQIQSDDKKLNLSPFELYYDEKRQFFTEGVELFDRGGIFYSRRIGSTPKFSDEIELNENEITSYNPSETQLVNATKISGRNKNGWGVGFLNAMSLTSKAIIIDTINGTERQSVVQPFTNYNVSVLDKSLPNNSFFSLINTNVSMIGSPFMANVTATDFQIRNKSKSYMLKGKGAVSIRGNENKETGYYALLGLEKNKGKIFSGISEYIYSDKYNPNDLGYLQRNNQVTSEIWVYSQIIQPYWILRELNGDIWYNYNRMYSPSAFYDQEFGFDLSSRFTNNYQLNASLTINSDKYDYYEPRVKNRFFYSPFTSELSLYAHSDQRKNLSLGISYHNTYQPAFEMTGNSITTSLSWRVGQQFEFELENQNGLNKNEYGFSGISNLNDSIIFSRRNVRNIVNTLNSSYIINNTTSLSLRARHYWSGVENLENYFLKSDGKLKNIINDNYDFNQNYNALTIDVLLKWIFAPGSELSFAWKTFSYQSNENLEKNYLKNLSNTWFYRNNSVSLKVLYYFDYNKFFKIKKQLSFKTNKSETEKPLILGSQLHTFID